MPEQSLVVGIDLGTTNTLACYLKKSNGKPDLIKFPGSDKLLPSIIYVDGNGQVLVGKTAMNKGRVDPLNQIRSSKTYMADFAKTWVCNGKKFTPTTAAVEILKEVRRNIVKRLKCEPDVIIKAVITVPAYFNSNQTDETRKAGIEAGFNVLRIVTEPMAAAVAAVKEMDLNKKIFVLDLGGGTFDLSVLEADQSQHSYRALAIDGDRHLGGDDFDKKVYDYFIKIIESDLGLDLSTQIKSGLPYNDYYSMVSRIQEEAEKTKIALSEELEYEVNVPNLFTYNGKDYNFEIRLNRNEFNDICQDLYDKIFTRVHNFIQNSREFRVEEIETVILAGGSCYIPYIQKEAEKIFHQSVDTQMDRSTLVALGAFFVAQADEGGLELNVEDIISHSLGVEILNDKNQLVLSKLLQKGEAYPCEHKKVYTTTVDGQTQILVNVYEAGSDAENLAEITRHDFYGSLLLEGIRPAPKGVPQIVVTFSYDKSRCLTVTAEDEETKLRKVIQIHKGAKVLIKSPVKAVDFMLLLDISGSMNCNDALPQAKKACYALINEMINFSVHRMGLITFASEAATLIGLCQNPKKIKLFLNNVVAFGTTNLYDALCKAKEALSGCEHFPVIVIVTDGDPDKKDETIKYAHSLIQNEGIRIVAIGVGDDVKETLLEKIASINDNYKLENMSELQQTFKEVIYKITERSEFDGTTK